MTTTDLQEKKESGYTPAALHQIRAAIKPLQWTMRSGKNWHSTEERNFFHYAIYLDENLDTYSIALYGNLYGIELKSFEDCKTLKAAKSLCQNHYNDIVMKAFSHIQ